VSITYNHGIELGLIKGLPPAIDLIGAYIIARSSIVTVSDLKRVLTYMAPVFFIAGYFVMVESVSHKFIIKPIFDAYFGARQGGLGTALENYEQRYGLTRGLGPFPHPILAGLCLSLALPLYWGLAKSDNVGTPRLIGLAAGGLAVFSVSSTAFVSLAISCGLLAYDALTRRVAAVRWDVLLTICAALGAAIQFGYNGGLLKFGIRFAVSGGSAWFRYAEWQYGGLSVSQHPIFGIGLDEYSRPEWMITSSIDSEWLLFAVNYGLPCCLSYLILLLSSTFVLARASATGPIKNRIMMRSLAFCIVNLIISGFFVSYFGGTQNWMPLMAGAAVSLGEFRPAQRA